MRYTLENQGVSMFESIEIRKVANGFILTVTTEDDTKEFVYDTSRKALRVIKQYIDSGQTSKDTE